MTRMMTIGLASLVGSLLLTAPLSAGPAGKDRAHATTARSGGLVERIERKADRQLTADERAGTSEAVQSLVRGMAPPRNEFVRQISQISGVSTERVWQLMPTIGGPADQDKNMMPKLEAEMGRRLTPEELGQVRSADERKKAAIQALRNQFADTVSKLTGVEQSDLLAMLPKVGI